MKRFVVIALVNVVLAGGAATYSTASTSLAAKPGAPVVISAVAFRGNTAALYPGRSVRVKATLTNNTTSRLRVDAVPIDGSVANLPRGCRPSWFRFADGRSAVVVAGNGGAAGVGGTLTFVDTSADQSACAGAAPTLKLRALS